MSNECSLDEMVRSLQMSVDRLGEDTPEEKDSAEDFTELSTSELQRKLEEKYFSAGEAGVHETDKSYELDSSFLAEFSDLDEPEVIETEQESTEILEMPAEPEALEVSEEIEEFEESEEIIEESEELEEDEELADLVEEYEDNDSFEELDVIDMQTELEMDEAEHADVTTDETDSIANDDMSDEFDPFAVDTQKEKPKSFKSLIMDYGRPDPIPSPKIIEEETAEVSTTEETPDVGDILSDFADSTPTEEERRNTAVKELMSALGCEEELECVSAKDIGAIYGQLDNEAAFDSEAEAVEHKKSIYKKSVVIASLKVVACALITFVMLLYDLLPVLDVDFWGPADYTLYPGAYVLIGTQLLLICAVCLWSYIWSGIKGLLSVYPNIYSMAVVTVGACVVYDTVFFLTGSYTPLETPTFHFLCGIFLTTVAVYGLTIRARTAGAYNIYSADMAKFTLVHDKSRHSVGEKMYSGGFSKDKNIYSPTPVSDPKGFHRAIEDNGSFGNNVFSSLILMSVGIGVIFGIVLMIVGRSLEESAAATMATVMIAMPVSAIGAIGLPLTLSWLRLRKRGIALTGRDMIKKYGADNALVFSDLHLFSKCDPKHLGFVCYEEIQTKRVLAALDILYSRIGGPMGEVFANIPDEIKAKSILVRRITKSGIEAVVDKSHVLIVGDIDFLRRYGIVYPPADARFDKKDSLYISLDGRPSARLMATYRIEPLFDMLIERLSAEGIHCVIETYDPMINTAFAARRRKKGRSAISVVHKNASDINRPVSNAKKRSDHGILALSSRLKLAEAVVWCARLCSIEKLLSIIVCASVGVGFAMLIAPAILGVIPFFIQYVMLAYMLIVFAALLVLTVLMLPSGDYFTVDALLREDAEREEKNNDTKEKTKKK